MPIRIFISLIFLFCSVFFAYDGSYNVGSRLAALAALKEDSSPVINRYVESPMPWTIDWAKTPDGQYYSNKGPLSYLLAYPLYSALDSVLVEGFDNRQDRDNFRFQHSQFYSTVLAFFLQVIPWVLAVLFLLPKNEFQNSKLSEALFCLLLYFGCTTAFFHNSLFAHSMAALLLFCSYFLYKKKNAALGPFLAGLLWGLSVGVEYSCLIFVSRLAFQFNARKAFFFVLGSALPLIALGYFHSRHFGAPLHLASFYQNPVFVSPSSSESGVLRFFSSSRIPQVSWEMLFGGHRGLLWTCPWLLVVFASQICFALKRKITREELGLFIPLVLFFFMNASFDAWHSGASPGLRYLAPIMPLAGILFVKASKKIPVLSSLCIGYGLLYYLKMASLGSLLGDNMFVKDVFGL